MRLALDFEWRTTVLTLLLLPLLIGLGLWQLDREEEKRDLAAQFAERQARAAADLAGLDPDRSDLAYLPVMLRGQFMPGQYLLQDNRIQGGQFGYEVIGLFRLAGGAGYALVNRGWTAGDAARRTLPDVTQPAGEFDLRGQVYIPPDPPYLLAEQALPVDNWPRVIQALETGPLVPALERRLGAAVFPHAVRLDADQPGALSVDWKVVNLSPQTHRGYAVQWFTMAAVLLLFFVFRSSNLWDVLRHRTRQER
ncbi:MAG: SURF1 family protein [Chromatocurvus sp.]